MNQSNTSGFRSQRGVALLITLAVVVLASALGLALIERVQSALTRTQAVMDRSRVDALSDGMYLLSQQGLERLQANARQGDYATDLSQWSTPYAIPGGVVQGRLIGLGDGFNVNALLHPDPQARARAYGVLERLLVALRLDRRLANEMKSWLDGRQASSEGANGTNLPDAMAGRGLLHVSELKEFSGLDQNTYQALLPWIHVVPSPNLSIDINEVSPELLLALIPALDIAQAERILMDQPFRDLAAFWAHPIWSGLDIEAHQRDALVAQTVWYLGQSRVTLEQAGEPSGVSYDAFRLISTQGSGYDFRYISQGIP